MIINRESLYDACPIIGMEKEKLTTHGISYGLSEAGYDIRIKQSVVFDQRGYRDYYIRNDVEEGDGRFCLASSIEEFQMPPNLVAEVKDKSTWARRGLSVFNTVIEPGWNGFLTLELVYHGNKELIIPSGSGIAQVIFYQLTDHARYKGKYQNQENKPVEAR